MIAFSAGPLASYALIRSKYICTNWVQVNWPDLNPACMLATVASASLNCAATGHLIQSCDRDGRHPRVANIRGRNRDSTDCHGDLRGGPRCARAGYFAVDTRRAGLSHSRCVDRDDSSASRGIGRRVVTAILIL